MVSPTQAKQIIYKDLLADLDEIGNQKQDIFLAHNSLEYGLSKKTLKELLRDLVLVGKIIIEDGLIKKTTKNKKL